MYCIAENVGGSKYWRIKLFNLFGEENFGEYGLQIKYRYRKFEGENLAVGH